MLAKELSANGFRVAVLEQGPYLTEADFNHNEIEVVNQNKLTKHPELQPTTFRETPQDKAKHHRTLVYGFYLFSGRLGGSKHQSNWTAK